eukprot:TRINITY_DN8394_c0_g1_i1.p1 TRINITY_DN8394_c0_g1~~TRINITY_DN8394_c0_g1_i1.p1  ORF type:complete len:376 (+),score=50.77 TRINITY_DN8394_c0_g1_i1:498-1625(+)
MTAFLQQRGRTKDMTHDRLLDYYPHRDDISSYLESYAAYHAFNIAVNTAACAASLDPSSSRIAVTLNDTSAKNNSSALANGDHPSRDVHARCVVSCTGTFTRPFIPRIERHAFKGMQIHSSQYVVPAPFQDLTVAVVGDGNSAAQIVADLSGVAKAVKWITPTAAVPQFYPPEVDGSLLFTQAVELKRAQKAGEELPAFRFDKIVQVEPVRRALAGGVFSRNYACPSRLYASGLEWDEAVVVVREGTEQAPAHDLSIHRAAREDGGRRRMAVDAIVWATGFRPALSFLEPMLSHTNGTHTKGTAAPPSPSSLSLSPSAPPSLLLRDRSNRWKHGPLWLIGYGDWCGYGSGSIVGVQWSVEQCAAEVRRELEASQG